MIQIYAYDKINSAGIFAENYVKGWLTEPMQWFRIVGEEEEGRQKSNRNLPSSH